MSTAQAATRNTTYVPIPERRKEPIIEVLRDGNVIRTIRVSCVCGCEIDIDCEYDDKPSE